MAKIPFDIKYKHHILTGKAEVVTRSGLSVEILKWDVNRVDYPILGLVVKENAEVPTSWTLEGRAFKYGAIADSDLFIIIPDPEPTEFEKSVLHIMKETLERGNAGNYKADAEMLLNLAKKELRAEFDTELEKAYKTADEVVYKRGYEDALETMPMWEKMFEGDFRGTEANDLYLLRNGYKISLKELDKLPRE